MTGSILNQDTRLYEKLKGWKKIEDMDIKTVEEKIAELERRLFAINMQDYYELGDYALETKIKKELEELKKQVKDWEEKLRNDSKL